MKFKQKELAFPVTPAGSGPYCLIRRAGCNHHHGNHSVTELVLFAVKNRLCKLQFFRAVSRHPRRTSSLA